MLTGTVEQAGADLSAVCSEPAAEIAEIVDAFGDEKGIGILHG